MITTIACPHCKRCLCIQNSDEVIDLICSGCIARYLASFAVLRAATWQIGQSDSANAKSHRIYDLRILANQTTQSFRLVHPSQKEILSLVADDKLLLLYEQHSGELALVSNLTADWKVSLISSWENHFVTVVGIAAGILLGGYLLGTNILQNYLPAKLAPLAGVGLAAPIAFIAAKNLRRPPFIETDEKAIAQLSLEQNLLLKQRELQEKLETLEEQKRQNIGVQERFKKLHSQLLDISEQGNPLKTVEKAEALVQEQGLLIQKLIAGYERMHERVEIDLSASQLVEALPANQIFENMADLDLLERQREEIANQIDSVTR